MIWMGFGLGLRAGEVAAARIENLRLHGAHPFILVDGKGGRRRRIPLPDPVRQVLARYLAGRPRSGPVIEHQQLPGRHINSRRVSRVVGQAMREAGIPDAAHHALRHTFCTLLLEQGRGAKSLLGEQADGPLQHHDHRTDLLGVPGRPGRHDRPAARPACRRRRRAAMSALTWSGAWTRYSEHLRVDLRQAASTVKNRRYALWTWAAYLEGLKPPKTWQKATPRDLARFLDRKPASPRAKGPKMAANTVQSYAISVCMFYRWAHKAGLTSNDRMRAFTLPKGGRPEPRALDLADVRTIFLAAAGDERLQLMLWLAFGCGMRVAEIAAAKIEDVRLRADPPVLVVPKGKGDKARTVPLAEPVAAFLAGHLSRRPLSGPLVENHRVPGTPLNSHTVGVWIARHMRAVGVQESAHALRHSYATELLRAAKGTNLFAVSKALGHSDTGVTEAVYVNSYSGDLAGLAALLPDPRAGNGNPGGVPPTGLAAMVPVDVRDQLAAAVATLERYGPEVARAVATLGKATHQAWLATMGVSTDAEFLGLHPDDPRLDHTDVEWDDLEDQLGIRKGWDLAYALRDVIDD
jgi:integrase